MPSAVVFLKPTRPGPFERCTRWMRQPKVGEDPAPRVQSMRVPRPMEPSHPRPSSTASRVSASLQNLGCSFLSPVPKVHSILMAFLFRTWAPDRALRPGLSPLGRGAPLSRDAPTPVRPLYSQAGGVRGQGARQRPPARRRQFPATAVQQRAAAGAGRGAEARPGGRQQEEGLGEEQEPAKGSAPTLQQRRLPDASGRRRHFPPRPGLGREEPPVGKDGFAETFVGCTTTPSPAVARIL